MHPIRWDTPFGRLTVLDVESILQLIDGFLISGDGRKTDPHRQSFCLAVLAAGELSRPKAVSPLNRSSTNGVRHRGVSEPVRLEILGRKGIFEVVDIDEHLPNLLGQIPLEYLDLVIDNKSRKLIPNPEHGEKLMTEEF